MRVTFVANTTNYKPFILNLDQILETNMWTNIQELHSKQREIKTKISGVDEADQTKTISRPKIYLQTGSVSKDHPPLIMNDEYGSVPVVRFHPAGH